MTASSPDRTIRHILVVEDDYFIADDMCRGFRKLGADVLGPVPTIDQATELVAGAKPCDAAVLDINLEGDGPVFPLADALRERGIPFVFATGYDDAEIPSRFGDVQRFLKPCSPDQILRHFEGTSRAGGVAD